LQQELYIHLTKTVRTAHEESALLFQSHRAFSLWHCGTGIGYTCSYVIGSICVSRDYMSEAASSVIKLISPVIPACSKNSYRFSRTRTTVD